MSEFEIQFYKGLGRVEQTLDDAQALADDLQETIRKAVSA